jgi:hypothetical protein
LTTESATVTRVGVGSGRGFHILFHFVEEGIAAMALVIAEAP